ncbi:MAG: hypothetical protein RIF33_06360 [Cyclobacteriaceae bacterium]
MKSPLTSRIRCGDTFYPGRLYVKDWMAFKKSIARLLEFTRGNEMQYILGNHIEMSTTPGRDYKMGTLYQPGELPFPLSTSDLRELHSKPEQLGYTPTSLVRDRSIPPERLKISSLLRSARADYHWK